MLVDDLEEVSPAALDLYSDLLVEHPSYIDCHLRMTEIHRKSGNLQQVLHTLRSAHRLACVFPSGCSHCPRASL